MITAGGVVAAGGITNEGIFAVGSVAAAAGVGAEGPEAEGSVGGVAVLGETLAPGKSFKEAMDSLLWW